MRQAETLRDGQLGVSSPAEGQALYDGPNSACREDTLAAHRRAVERVITTARERLCEPLSLRDISRVAYISTFHFNRVFHQITGLPPAKFISAMRLDEAKRLLLTTQLSVTDICYEVGYNSLGTFTRRFTELVGLGPRQFRRLAERITPASVESLCAHYAELTGKRGASPVGRGFRRLAQNQRGADLRRPLPGAHTAESPRRRRSPHVARRFPYRARPRRHLSPPRRCPAAPR